jgi:hypothetical protein
MQQPKAGGCVVNGNRDHVPAVLQTAAELGGDKIQYLVAGGGMNGANGEIAF